MSQEIELTDEMIYECVKRILAREFDDRMSKALIVKEFLDGNFKRADISQIGSDGYAESKPIVVYLDAYKQPIKNMTDEDLLDMLMDKFQNMFDDDGKRRKFLLAVMKSWYNKDKKLEMGLV